MPITPPLTPYPGFNNSTLQPGFTSTAVSLPIGPISGKIYSPFFKYSNFINAIGHTGDYPPHLPDNYPNGKKINLPNYFNPNQTGPGTYEQYYNEVLFPYYNNGPTTPPYYIGSTTIQDSKNPGLRPKLPSPLTKPTYGEGIKDLPTGNLFREVTVKKLNDNIEGIYKIGSNSYVGDIENEKLEGHELITKGVSNFTNISAEDAATRAKNILGLGLLSGLTGAPKVIQLGANAIQELENESAVYASSPFSALTRIQGQQFQDFRSYKSGIRLDGASTTARALTLHGGRGSVVGALYAGLAGLAGGAYQQINIESLYGFGEHGTPYALRKDFTSTSHVSSRWSKEKPAKFKKRKPGKLKRPGRDGAWVPPGFIDPISQATPFRGDKVSVIDFKQSNLDRVYKWVPESRNSILNNAVGAAAEKLTGRITKDFIKFFFTGPDLTPWADSEIEDDVMVFRAIITSLTDSFNPSWQPLNFIGRGDPAYNYGGYSRDINLDFTVYATDRDELKPIWRKLNALAGYTAPEYDGSSIALKGPYLRITIGDLYYQQPLIINSLYFTLQDSETTWEINVEEDAGMMQVPKQINVSLGGTLITDYIPQKGGRFYTLANRRAINSDNPDPGNDNWLSDMQNNEDIPFTIDSDTQQAGGTPDSQ